MRFSCIVRFQLGLSVMNCLLLCILRDFDIMNHTVDFAKANGVSVGAHPSLPDRQGFGRREMKISPVWLHGILAVATDFKLF